LITITLRPASIRNQHIMDQPDYMLINWRVSGSTHIWRPPTDVLELEENYLVRVEIAGMNEKDFDIILDQNYLTIKGVRPEISTRRAYHQMEINFGEFITTVEIPGPIDPQAVSAEYKAGFLTITLPKVTPKQIPING